jgi:hypothetical protein
MCTSRCIFVSIFLLVAASVFISVSCENEATYTVTGTMTLDTPLVSNPPGSDEICRVVISLTSDVYNPEYETYITAPEGTTILNYSIENVASGTYIIGAYIDVDGDGLPDDIGDYRGAYLDIGPADPPNAEVKEGNTSFDFILNLNT